MTQKPFNPFEHHHDHGAAHDHDHGHAHDHGLPTAELDPAQQSLADALRVSFNLLKLVMLVLAVLYLLSGIVWGIPAQEVALRLRFGQIVGDSPEQALLRPGRVHFAWPYPIDQVVFVPIASQQLDLTREFWFEIPPSADPSAAEGTARPLVPERDGSLLTGDGNIIHARWTVKYEIQRPLDFIRNITAPSSDPAKVLQAAQTVVRAAAEESAVFAAAQVSADEAIRGNLHADAAKQHMQSVLDGMHAGITITDVAAVTPRFPAAVQPAFREVTEAASEKAQKIEKARQERASTLNETAGAAYEPVRALIDQYEQARAANATAELARLDARLDAVFESLSAPRWTGQLTGAARDAAWDAYLQWDKLQRQGLDPAASTAAAAHLDAVLDQAGVTMADRQSVAVGGRVAQLINDARAARSSVVAQLQAEAKAFNPRAIDPASPIQGLLQQYEESPSVFVNRRWNDLMDQVLTSDSVEIFYLPRGQTYLELNRDQTLKRQREQQKLKDEQAAKAQG